MARPTTRRACCEFAACLRFFFLVLFCPFSLTHHSWAPQNYDKLRSWVPEGDPELQKAFLDEYLPSVQWMRENGVPTAPRFDGIMSIGMTSCIIPASPVRVRR